MIDLVEGWTEPIEYTVLADGAVVNLTGKTVTMLLYGQGNDQPITPSGVLSVPSPTTGLVRFTPAADDLLHSKSPYSVRFHIAPDGYFSPSGVAERWRVSKP